MAAIVLFVHLCLTGFGQEPGLLSTSVSINATSVSVKEILVSFEEKYGVKFSYSSNAVNLEKKVSLRLENVSLEYALKALLAKTNIRYNQVGGQIVLSKRAAKAKPLKASRNSIRGTVTDSETGLPVPGANVYLAGTGIGLVSDYNGTFIIDKIPDGNHRLVISMMGYKSDTLPVFLAEGSSRTIDHRMAYRAMELDVAIVNGDKITGRTTVSDVALTEKEITVSQSITEDPIQALGTLPGISRSGMLFDAKYSIRGGSDGENLYLLDNALVIFPWTFAGKSIYNPNIIEKAELLTGGFPVTYGHFMSSVLNITTKNGDMEKHRANASVTLLNAQVTAEGPLVKNKLSLIASGRRSVLDLLLNKAGGIDGIRFPGMKDITYKMSFEPTQRNRITYSGYHSGSDVSVLLEDSTGSGIVLEGANRIHTSSFQWQSQWSKKVYSKLSVLNSFLNVYMLMGDIHKTDMKLNDHYIREDITLFLDSYNKIKTGIETHYYSFDADGYEPLFPQHYFMNDTTLELYTYNLRNGAGIAGGYVLYDGTLYKRLKTNAGIRLDQDLPDGNTDIAPRAALSYEFDNNFEIRVAYGLYHQTVGPIAYNYNPSIRSGRCDHYIAGVKKRFSASWSGWIEAYYKDYKRIVLRKQFNWYSDEGTGYSRGAEVFIRKESGRIAGWISYSLSEARRKDSLEGDWYAPDLNQTHMFNLVMEYTVRKRAKRIIPSKIAANFRAATGSPYTPLLEAALVNNQWQPLFGQKNSARNPAYHNLNARISWERKLGKAKKHQWVTYFEIWNLFEQKSITGRGYEYNVSLPGNILENPSIVEPFIITLGFRLSLNVAG